MALEPRCSLFATIDYYSVTLENIFALFWLWLKNNGKSFFYLLDCIGMPVLGQADVGLAVSCGPLTDCRAAKMRTFAGRVRELRTGIGIRAARSLAGRAYGDET